MPFDTTYNVVNDNKAVSITVTIPGGKDTVINTNTKELPLFIQNNPELLKLLEDKERTFSSGSDTTFSQNVQIEPASKPVGNFNNILGVVFAILLFSIVFSGERIFNWIKNKNDFRIPRALAVILALGILTSFVVEEFFIALFLFILTVIVLISFRNELLFVRKTINLLLTETPIKKRRSKPENKNVFIYYGTALKFSNEDMEAMLLKHFPFFKTLAPVNRKKFIHRTRKFIYNKNFYLHTENGFKEMPVLVSASAIQLTFGLQDYLLHYFKNIHIYPEEFYRANDLGICFLEGNVSNNTVNLSWKHFLKGYSEITDGTNVGLHEFAHALYYQKCIVENDSEKTPVFLSDFEHFSFHGAKGFSVEQSEKILYSDYALKNYQEFWAESVEIFFERPKELKSKYSDIYQSIHLLLKQDPANESNLSIG